VGKIDETYGRWRDAHKLPARPLELRVLQNDSEICRRLRPKWSDPQKLDS
jgi:hypothetical protein